MTLPAPDPRVALDDCDLPDHLPPTEAVSVRRHLGAVASERRDVVAVESPVALVFNGLSHAVMMATPTDLEAFGLGFALSEGLIAGRDECRDIEVRAHARGCEVHLTVSSRAFAALKDRKRSLEGRTGCGLCGIDSLAQLDLLPAERLAEHALVPSEVVLRAFAALPARQALNADTGACHAAGWATPAGELLDVTEDVGRHNALDKLLGRRALAGRLGEPGFVVMSSRASYELVRKCARLQVGTLAAISAPTSLAIDIARQSGLQLYGFCRGEQAVDYTALAPAA
ncbi:formate dehydrogenase accessory sulfurtransferase FdhD [Rhizobacter sp. SG703]|uniref:formate dehydrogenase accessory sulfurtransferase FdhD n=1 Tax=Rhizobacter sp. SG703 TaxID=2587140 RepID=UPI001445DE53|nr:formate dehydrogenase accessory sulfurtransferase FdhD [Rhizobacter sp. SG703]NKI96990.1 FdhD protein [Rhizobacter sp. SG703]